MDSSSSRRVLLLACAAVALVAAGTAHAMVIGDRSTAIVSPPAASGTSDGDSDNVAFSQDNRHTRFMAFDSGATNIVAGDTNRKRDVFLNVRSRPGDHGNFDGKMMRVSVPASGRQANGDSVNPSIDGDFKRRPHCIAFESAATNMAKGDRSRDWDVFVYDTRRRRSTLVSVGRTNARNGVVDGECEFVTFESGGYVYVRGLKLRSTTRIARGANPDQATNGKGVAYERDGQVYYQGFIEKFRSKKKGGSYVKEKGREVLVSANANRQRGNGSSGKPSLDDNGWYVAFESTATNLCEAGTGCPGVGTTDRNGEISDVFRRNLNPRRAPTREHMAMVSYSQGCTRDAPDAKEVDAQGDGPSNNPAMTGAGENIVFDSEAANLKQSGGIRVADGNGTMRDVYYWNFPHGRRCGNVSRESRGEGERGVQDTYNGASVKPAASSRANFIGFTSMQTGQSGETNGAALGDVFVRFLGAGPGTDG